jgi:peptidylprolyl isomerase
MMRSLVFGALFSLIAAAATAQIPVPAPPDVAAPPADAMKTPSGLAYKVIKPGKGTGHPTLKDLVVVNYTGWTTDGKTFDTSLGKGALNFPLDKMIPGWREGLQLMVQGETRRFWIPESLAYQGRRDPRGMLVFEIELIDFQPNTGPGALK